MINIQGFNTFITLTATFVYPAGIIINQFADDADPFDMSDLKIADAAMGVNGDLITWSTANPIEVKISVIPGGTDDLALALLFERNRPSKNKFLEVTDEITMIRTLPSGSTRVLTGGACMVGAPGTSVSSAGRQKSNGYMFNFEN